MANKKAIIVGIDGMDGGYLSELLFDKGYEVFGVTKRNVKHLSRIIADELPDEIYNFAGVSDVFSPFERLDEIFEVNGRLPQRILETILSVNKNIKFFQASSCLIFGRDKSGLQNEQTPFNPLYAYGAAKLYAQNIVREFRETYGIHACSGIFFNHESERRKEHFFSRKICKAAATKTKITVGNLDAYRDYGYAKEYVEAAHLMLQTKEPKDYVIGTGDVISLRDFAKKAFEYVGLDYRDYVTETEVRKIDTEILRADITAIKNDLGWYPKINAESLIKIMVDADRVI